MSRDELNYWQRLSLNRTSRRRVLLGAGTAGLGVAAVGLVGCGDDDDDGGAGNGGATSTSTGAAQPTVTTPGQGEQPKKGGTFTLHMGGSPRSLDPHFDTFPYCTAVVCNTNEALLRFTPDLKEIEPELAASMPENPDAQTFTLKLKPGIMGLPRSDGHPR